MPGEVRARRQEGIGAATRRQERLQTGGRARGGAHVEHALHVCDAGGVEAQLLVERRHGLPRAERGAHGGGRAFGLAYTGADGVQHAWETRDDCILGTEQA